MLAVKISKPAGKTRYALAKPAGPPIDAERCGFAPALERDFANGFKTPADGLSLARDHMFDQSGPRQLAREHLRDAVLPTLKGPTTPINRPAMWHSFPGEDPRLSRVGD